MPKRPDRCRVCCTALLSDDEEEAARPWPRLWPPGYTRLPGHPHSGKPPDGEEDEDD
jgi:hypothetical protein